MNDATEFKIRKSLIFLFNRVRALVVGDKCKTQICLNLAKYLISNGAEFNQLKNEIDRIEPNVPGKRIQVPRLSGGESKSLKNASIQMELHKTADCGNFVVANKKIDAGDVLVVEKPLAVCLLPKFFGSHCVHCMKRIKVAYGCSNCAGVAFCSPVCQKIACSTYHKFECKYNDLLVGSGMSILCFIALRLITQHDDPWKAIEEGRRITRELCSNSYQRNAADYFQRTVMAAFLLRILQKADYFGRRTSESAYPNSDAEFQIGEILIGLLQVLQFNAHEIFETKTAENDQLPAGKFLYIAVGIYNSAVYFNHSCYPAVVRYFVGTNIVLCATRPLEPGETVSENYGPIFTTHTLRERQRNLRSRYWFLCECICCKENWPTLSKLNNNSRLRCPTKDCPNVHRCPVNVNENIKCINCKKMVNFQIQLATVKKSEELYRNGAELMDKDNYKEAATAFLNGINLFYTVAVPPHRDTHIAQESLRTCLSAFGQI